MTRRLLILAAILAALVAGARLGFLWGWMIWEK